MPENILINETVEKFREATGLELLTAAGNGGVELQLKIDEYTLTFTALVRSSISKSDMGILRSRLYQNGEPVILITRYMSREMAALARNLDLNFIDAAGNAYINRPPLYIFVQGNRIKIPEAVSKLGRVFKPVGLQIIYTLLCNPELEANTMREIAQYSGVGLTSVQKAFLGLQNEGFLVIGPKRQYKLINKHALLRKWAALYPEKLKVKLTAGRFSSANDTLFSSDISKQGACWGGETAAARLTSYLRPVFHTIYADKKRMGEFLLRNKMKKDPSGNIEVIEKFWSFEAGEDHPELVHPILIYADLMATGEPRNVETAEIIYERKIAGLI